MCCHDFVIFLITIVLIDLSYDCLMYKNNYNHFKKPKLQISWYKWTWAMFPPELRGGMCQQWDL